MAEIDDDIRMDRLLGRWCKRRDVDALGALFDLAAPRLLRVAVHVIGDLAAAEDLVQATFLATIERREHIDTGRPAMQWLIGVLHHKAIDARRKRGIRGEGSSLELDSIAGSEQDVSARLEARELSAEVAASIDRLEAPYRQVLLLRLRHGASIAEVAHLLERSPATVRVQLHRGLEQLRNLLPRSLALAALGALGERGAESAAPRGLAAIKSALLADASLAPAPLSLVSWIGVQVMGQKSLAAGLTLVVLASLLIVRALDVPQELEAEPSTRESPQSLARHELLVSHGPIEVLEASPEPILERVAASESPAPSAASLTGVVVDALTGAPVAGATVATHPPLRGTLMALLAARPELFRVQNDGIPRSHTGADWPLIVGLDAAARFDGAELEVYADVVSSGAPETSAMTDAAGRFTLPSASGVVLVASAEGYAPRACALVDDRAPCRIELRAARHFHGQVTLLDGTPIGEPLELAISARLERATTESSDGVSATRSEALERQSFEGLGTWRLTTDAEGRFEGWFGADKIQVTSLDHRWASWGLGTLLEPDVAGKVLVQPLRSLHVFDAATGAPLEVLRLVCRERANGYIQLAGAFHAPGGCLALPEHGIGFFFSMHRNPPSFTVWARGYAPTIVDFDAEREDGTIDVPLSVGTWAGVEGFVHRGGVLASGVEVALLGHNPLSWSPDENTLIDGARTDQAGRFALGGPAGRALLRVVDEDTSYLETVELPVTQPLDIDLAQLAVIHVRVRHPDGAAVDGHVVGLRGADGRGERLYVDASGDGAFTGLAPGRYTVSAPFVTTTSSFGGDVTEVLDLARGGDVLVTLAVPDSSLPRYLSIAAAGTDTFVGWRARFGEQAWALIEPSGRVPLDLNTDQWQLYVAAPDGRRWNVALPRAAPDGHVVHLTSGAGRFEGVLLDAKGTPQAGIALQFTPWGPFEGPRPTSQCVSDDAGRFALGGLALSTHRVQLSRDPDSSSSRNSVDRLERTVFLTDSPSPDGTWLELRLARQRPKVRLAGSVRDAAGQPLTNGMVLYIVEDRNDAARAGATLGALTQEVADGSGFQRLDERGAFSIDVPRHERCVLRIYGPELGPKALLEHIVDLSGEAEFPPIDLVVP
jgi:RNA polymerase sigma-70 factor (ECF subfamily)